MTQSAPFLFATCQVGVESALKEEVARRWPSLKFAFSRPGFVTFKDTADAPAASANPLIGSAFARTCGRSLGKIDVGNAEQGAAAVVNLVGERTMDHLHIWPREKLVPGEHGYVPGATAAELELGEAIRSAFAADKQPRVNELARPNQSVLDCVVVEPNQWWLGEHHVESVPQRWPGGVPKLTPPDEMISRAYLKIGEALAWSRLPAAAGDAFVEIGCAPGGSAQALLDRGFTVTGIDPADVDQRLRDRAGFTHIRKRGADLKRREFRPFQWLTADLNVAPSYTLDTVENIVTHEDVRIAGMLLTLKLMDRPLYGQIGDFLQRIRDWGYEEARARQLAFNRQEMCVAALRSKAMRRGKK